MSNFWMLRPSPDEKNRMNEFLSKNIIAIGWPDIPDLSTSSKDTVQSIVENSCYEYTPKQNGIHVFTISSFVHSMIIGDIVLVPDKETIHFCKIETDYFFSSEDKKDGYPHQRKVAWIASVSRTDLPEALKKTFRAHRTITNLEKYRQLIEAFLEAEKNKGYIEVNYPLRPDKNVKLRVPDDTTKDEAERISDFAKTIFYR